MQYSVQPLNEDRDDQGPSLSSSFGIDSRSNDAIQSVAYGDATTDGTAGETDLRDAVKDKDPKGFHQVLAGVQKDCRGKGIAMAMKLKVIEYAKNNGYNSIRTENSTLNAEMLSINKKLGFEKGPAWITFSKTLASHLPLRASSSL